MTESMGQQQAARLVARAECFHGAGAMQSPPHSPGHKTNLGMLRAAKLPDKTSCSIQQGHRQYCASYRMSVR